MEDHGHHYALGRADVVRVQRLLDECRELWADALAWQKHVASAIEEIVGGFLGVLILSDRRSATPTIVDMSLGRSIPSNASTVLGEFAAQGGESLVPNSHTLRPVLLARGYSCSTLSSLAGGTYRASEFFQRYMRPLHAHDTLCAVALGSDDPAMACSPNLTLAREAHEAPFSEREHHVLAAIAEGLGARVGTQLVTPRQTGRHDLTPRECETLDGLLAGDSEKQVAARLGISTTTVHEHVTTLYRNFGVHSRGELCAIFLQRVSMPSKPTRIRARAVHGRAASEGGVPFRSSSS